MVADRRTSVGLAQSFSRAFGEPDVLCFSTAAEFIQGANGLFEGGIFSCRVRILVRCLHFLGAFSFLIRTGIDSVEIVEIRGETKSVDGSLDVFLDVSGRVGNRPLGSEDVESTLGGHCAATQCEPMTPYGARRYRAHRKAYRGHCAS